MKSSKTITYIPTDQIRFSALNPRKTVDETELQELAASIRENGVIQPIVVRLIDASAYEVVCGERRLRASVLAGQKDIPAIVRELTDDQAMDMAITENLQRRDISPMEEAAAFCILAGRGQTAADLSARFGKSVAYIRGRLRLTALHEGYARLLSDGRIRISHCMELCKYPAEVQESILEEHYNPEKRYYSWFERTLPDLKDSLSQYTSGLEDAAFDKTECYGCPDNTAISMLFPELEKVSCCNKECFRRKTDAFRLQQLLEVCEKTPDVPLFLEGYYVPDGDHVCKYLKEHRIPFLTSQNHNAETRPEPPIREEGDNDEAYGTAMKEYGEELREFEDGVTAGRIIRAYRFLSVYNNSNGIVWISSRSGNIAADPKQEAIRELKKKNERNKELAGEKMLGDCKKIIDELEAETIPGAVTDLESRILLVVMLERLSYKHDDQIFGIEKLSHCDIGKMFEITGNLTGEQKAVIIRDFIASRIGETTFCGPKADLFVDWVASHFPEKVAEIRLKHREMYLRRKEKIDARMAEIELENEGK